MIFLWRRPSKNENVTSSSLTPSDWPIEVRINRKQLDPFGSAPLFHVSPRFAFLRRLPTAFTTDYTDSADNSVIAEHPWSSVTSVVKIPIPSSVSSVCSVGTPSRFEISAD
jgi:hypothetical protein